MQLGTAVPSLAATTASSSEKPSSTNSESFISALEALQSQHAAAQNPVQSQPLMQKMLSGSTTTSSTTPASRSLGGIDALAARLSNKQANGNVVNVSSSPSPALSEMCSVPNGNASTTDASINLSNNTPALLLACTQCNLEKTTAEEMEIHIKTEHLNWQPFQCPLCLSERASDAQMREHLFSSHRKNMNKFIYVDNVTAKRQLAQLMDKALYAGMKKRIHGRGSDKSEHKPPKLVPITAIDGEDQNTASLAAMTSMMTKIIESAKNSAQGYTAVNGFKEKANGTSLSKTSSTPLNSSLSVNTNGNSSRKRSAVDIPATNTDSLLASINRAAGDIDGERETPDDSSDPFALFNIKRMKTEGSTGDENEDEEDILNGVNPISVLDNVAALFSSADGRLLDSDFGSTPPLDKSKNGTQSGVKFGGSVAKKRVLGECSKCQKPVTAGARQMHMFFHLAKDENTFRFRCLFPGCNVEHYRKDQMENHQSKVHGKIDAEKMVDRSIELFNRCQDLSRELFVYRHQTNRNEDQELSMELLGTKNGSIPGPTAAKAEIAYAAQLAAAQNKEGKKVERNRLNRPPQEDEHPLECKICHKTMQNRIRGFHILWHLAKDMGINRYTCKFCQFGHDRSQSVQTHGKKEHGTEDCVEDRIHEYSDDVKKMSEMCFGFQALFAQDSKRRSKIPIATTPINKSSSATSPNAASDSGDGTEDYGAATPKEEIIDESGIFKQEDEGEEDENNDEDDDVYKDDEENDVSYGSRASKKRRQGRFGFRKSNKNKKEQQNQLRILSMILGGNQYFRKKVNETAYCNKCDKLINNRMSEHAYGHLDQSQLFLCPICDIGTQSRETVQRHIRELHPGYPDKTIDNRLKHAQEIKEIIKECYPEYFVDNPIPTATEIDKLLAQVKGGDELRKYVAGLAEVSTAEPVHEDAKTELKSENNDENAEDTGDETDHGMYEENDTEDEEVEEIENTQNSEQMPGLELEEEAEDD